MAASVSRNIVQLLGRQYNADSWTNITPKIIELAERGIYKQPSNPLFLICERIRHFFRQNSHLNDIGYHYDEHHYENPVVTLEDNFDSLLIAKDHVSRSKSDTYYVNSTHLLRSHTSAHQMHCLLKGSKAFISSADCFRRDEIDRSHFPVFHQCEVFKLYNHKEALGQQAQTSQLYGESRTENDLKQAIYSHEASAFAESKLKFTVEKFVRSFFDDPSLQSWPAL